jgi:hypothetical protein
MKRVERDSGGAVKRRGKGGDEQAVSREKRR